MLSVKSFLTLFLILSTVSAQFFNFENMFHGGGEHPGQQQAKPAKRKAGSGAEFYRENYENTECSKYLCEDSLACVNKPVDCPCLFPNSEIKCILPNKKSYVCISKPDQENGRDCSFVKKAYEGKL